MKMADSCLRMFTLDTARDVRRSGPRSGRAESRVMGVCGGRHTKCACYVAGLVGALWAVTAAGAEAQPTEVSIRTAHVRYVIGSNGRNRHFIDTATGEDYLAADPEGAFARLRVGERTVESTGVRREADRLHVTFGDSGMAAELRVVEREEYFVLQVLSLSREQEEHPAENVEEFVFLDVPLALKASPDAPFGACALALDLRTRVHELPGYNNRLRAVYYPRLADGWKTPPPVFTGSNPPQRHGTHETPVPNLAAVAVVGVPPERLRKVIQQVVMEAPELPKSPVGGPWALDAPINQGSYLFNFSDLSEETVDDWIRVARQVGVNQIDFHGGTSFRHGDLLPNPQTYPRGRASLKAVIDRLHAAGIKAGLHTYAFFVAKQSEWVTPVPDPRLAKFATFTLAEDLAPDAATVPVLESTQDISTITGFFVWNSVTLQIGDELIVFSGASKEPPYAFTQVQRGALGTTATQHAKGAPVHHLKECFGLFLPDGESTLFAEVAARTAEMFNECGFDMMYLDALDGEGIIRTPQEGWHYGAKFVFEIMSRIERPALMEMSIFHHHLWYVRSRYCAWDHPNRGHKRFIDIHVASNNDNRRIFMPGHLGWWAVKTWQGHQGEPTFPDDIEYLMGKGLGTDTGFSIMGINPHTINQVPAYGRLAGIMRQYEELRHRNYFPQSVKEQLRAPGAEFTLVEDGNGGWTFRPVRRHRHKITADERSRDWSVDNPYGRQPARLRIEALLSAGPYEDADNPTVVDWTDLAVFSDRQNAPGVAAELAASTSQVKIGGNSGVFQATREAAPEGGSAQKAPAWAKVGRTFPEPLNLAAHQGLGVWVHGDGGGQVLNLQVRSPDHITRGIGDRYIDIDFVGWRYVELVEFEGERVAEFTWPYSYHYYALYREHVADNAVESLSLWYNNLPADGTSTVYLSPIKAIPLVQAKLVNPTVTINGQRLVFPISMETGSYLEFTSPDDCLLYGPQGQLLAQVRPEGDAPIIEPGSNSVAFHCGTEGDTRPRAYVSVIADGQPLEQ